MLYFIKSTVAHGWVFSLSVHTKKFSDDVLRHENFIKMIERHNNNLLLSSKQEVIIIINLYFVQIN